MKTGHAGKRAEAALGAWILIGLLAALCPAGSWAQGAPPEVMPLELARYIALEHVHANNQPFAWEQAAHRVLVDIEGQPTAHAFLFAKTGGVLSGADSLADHVAAKADADPDELYAFNDVATVITGTTDDSALILRHFRGIPEFWVEAIRQDAARGAGSRESTQVIMVTPMDFRLVAVEAGPGVKAMAPAGRPAPVALAKQATTLETHSGKKEKISALRQQAMKREADDQKWLAAADPELRDGMRAAAEEAAADRRSRWHAKRDAWEAAQSQGGTP